MRRLDHCNIVSLLYFFYTSGEKKVGAASSCIFTSFNLIMMHLYYLQMFNDALICNCFVMQLFTPVPWFTYLQLFHDAFFYTYSFDAPNYFHLFFDVPMYLLLFYDALFKIYLLSLISTCSMMHLFAFVQWCTYLQLFHDSLICTISMMH